MLQIQLIAKGAIREEFNSHDEIEPYLIDCIKKGLDPKETIALNDFENGELIDEFRGEVWHMVDSLDLKQLYDLQS